MSNFVVEDKSMQLMDLVHWALTHGIIMSCKHMPGEPPALLKTTHAPFSLHSYAYPEEPFNKAKALAPIFNSLVHKISLDSDWLVNVLQTTAHGDEFTGRLMKIYDTVLKEGIRQPVCLGINRSDYMLHCVPGDDRTLLQVEINTISSSFGSLSTKISEMYRRFEYADSTDAAVPLNTALTDIAAGIAQAHRTYLRQKPHIPSADTIILMVVQPNERNIADQRFLHYAIEEHNVKVVRATFQDIYTHATLNAVTGTLSYHGKTVSVVYYRAGYTPDDYAVSGSENEWEARLRVERSDAVKCPNIAYHLAGTKKVQQELASPGVLERFVSADSDDIKLLRSVFAGLYSLDPAEGDVAATKERALRSPEGFVLKPQREGGGNNLYNEELVAALKSLGEEELASYILMEKIRPPAQQAVLVRDCETIEARSLCELGIFGVHLNDPNAVDKAQINSYAGYLLRVKPEVANEGGVAAGFAVLSMVKLNANKTSSRRKMRKAHFGASSVERRVRMSAALNKELFQRHHVRSIPLRKDDEVKVIRGQFKGKEGKIVQVYRKKYVVHVERCTRDKANGQTIHVGIDASNVEITKLKMDKSRKAILDRKNRTKIGQSKGDVTSSLHDNLAGVD